MDGAPWLVLCSAILRRVPKLDGALCAGRAELFDAADAERAATALALCSRCPAQRACAAWLASIPIAHRPPGVVAGKRNGTASTANVGAKS